MPALSLLKRDLTDTLQSLAGEIDRSVDVDQFRSVSAGIARHEESIESLCDSLAVFGETCSALTTPLSSVAERIGAKLDERAKLNEQRERLRLLQRLAQTLHHLESLLDRPPAPEGAEAAEALDDLLRAAREMGRLRILRERGAEQKLRAVRPGLERWERVRKTLLHQLTDSLHAALVAGDEARAARVVLGFADADASAEATHWLRSEWVAPRLVPQLKGAVARGTERDALPRICAEVLVFARGGAFRPLRAAALADPRRPLHLLADCVWAEACAYLKGTPHLFGSLAGTPAALHAAYTATVALQAKLEALLQTPAERHYFRCHPSGADLMRRFNLPIYFQLRVQEIAKQLEAALARSDAAAYTAEDGGGGDQ
mmetsp:Transcript_46078/g.149694  ORF Transcript_46078/g.149694 Transcript_46078/m.149694 type:complete len:373 (-) Transcript_46078:281-1399(-)